MIRTLILALVLTCSSCFAEAPYDSVGKVTLTTTTQAGGSAFLVAKSGKRALSITNAHVVGTQKKKLVVSFHGDNTLRWAYPVHVDEELDIALLMSSAPSVDPIPWSKTRLRRGDSVTLIGYPAYDRNNLHWQTGQFVEYAHKFYMDSKCKEFIVTPAVTQRPVYGMSGGAAINQYGELVGVTVLFDAMSGGMVYDLKVRQLLKDYENPSTWVPTTAHIKPPEASEGGGTQQKQEIRTLRYGHPLRPKMQKRPAPQPTD